VADADLFLEVLDPLQDLDITAARSTVTFRRSLVPRQRVDDPMATAGGTLASSGTTTTSCRGDP